MTQINSFIYFSDGDHQHEKEDMIKSESNSQWSEDDSPPILVASQVQNSTNQKSSQKSREIDAANKLEPLLKPLTHGNTEKESGNQLPLV